MSVVNAKLFRLGNVTFEVTEKKDVIVQIDEYEYSRHVHTARQSLTSDCFCADCNEDCTTKEIISLLKLVINELERK